MAHDEQGAVMAGRGRGSRSRVYRPRGSGRIVGYEETDVNGILVRITRKQMKNLRIRIDSDGSVQASAPKNMPLSQIRSFIEAKEGWILQQQVRAESSTQAQADAATKQQVDEWRTIVSAAVPILLRKWEPVMGVHAEKVVYRNMKSRWGSCQPDTGRVCFNVRLALFPPQCLEYVVVHELCHLLERGHGPRFKQLMTQFLPNWKESRDLLKD